ncbi:ThiF family adenylyltransferase [Niallia sp. SS-2023]|uniref:ThiF family adenylyltransferase n=1 Tax=Niallia sp. SS-2023 TaxID=3051155 RepID=UPI002550B182|nr:ThiF family adenylyltransferase [Niallia sp. SS-2023]MDL0435607.1 ThiF family adenylyltransferase [Niallia sp. SS-2023]
MIGKYKKQELFIGESSQKRLQESHAVILGVGALGSSTAEMLTRAGVKKLTIIDRDYVEWSNLQRQQLYTEEDAALKLPKAIAAKRRLEQVNSDVQIDCRVEDITGKNIEEMIKGASIIIDGMDNFETRLIINDAAVKLNIPYIFGACVGSYGLTYPVIPGESPCLHCIIEQLPAQTETCDSAGIISPIVQLVAAFQAAYALRVLSGKAVEPILVSYDIWSMQKAEIHADKLKDPHCPACSQRLFSYLDTGNQTKTDILCGRDAIQIRPGVSQSFDLDALAKSIQHVVEHMIVNPYLLACEFEKHRVVLFKDGRAIIHGTDERSRARAIYSRLVG